MNKNVQYDFSSIQFSSEAPSTPKFQCSRSGGDVFGYYLERLNELFQDSPLRSTENQGFSTRDNAIAFCVAKDLIQDTHESLSSIGDSRRMKPGRLAYIEFWGTLQATVIQQDALNEMHRAITGIELSKRNLRPDYKICSQEAWTKIRETRHQLAGHPVHKSKGSRKMRTSISRMGLSATTAYIEQYDCVTGQTEHSFITLKTLIEPYDRLARLAIFVIYRAMRTKWKTERVQ